MSAKDHRKNLHGLYKCLQNLGYEVEVIDEYDGHRALLFRVPKHKQEGSFDTIKISSYNTNKLDFLVTHCTLGGWQEIKIVDHQTLFDGKILSSREKVIEYLKKYEIE